MRHERFDPVAAEESRLRQQIRHAKQAAKKRAKAERKKARKQRPEHPKPKAKPAKTPQFKQCKSFYRTMEWKRVRYDVLKESKGRCCLCGVSAHDGARLNVDHIKPVKTHWHLRLDKSNLQVLCGSCNAGKGNRDTTDWREEDQPEHEWSRIPWERFEKF